MHANGQYIRQGNYVSTSAWLGKTLKWTKSQNGTVHSGDSLSRLAARSLCL